MRWKMVVMDFSIYTALQKVWKGLFLVLLDIANLMKRWIRFYFAEFVKNDIVHTALISTCARRFAVSKMTGANNLDVVFASDGCKNG